MPPSRDFSNPVKPPSLYLQHAIDSIMWCLELCLLALVLGEGRGKQLEQDCLVTKDRRGGVEKVSLRMEQLALAHVKLVSTVKTCTSKSGVAMMCPLLGEWSPASLMPHGVLM